jgi:DNA-directed RNA polymerase subunit RPC12/RpoP
MWGYRCLRCEHQWVPRGLPEMADGKKPPEQDEEPRVCPKCKSPYWNRPRKAG